MFQDYLADEPTYGPILFRRRFVCIHLSYVHSTVCKCCMLYFYLFFRYWIIRELFLRIMNAVESHDDYFVQKRNVANVPGLS
jgi:hypothetical protein